MRVRFLPLLLGLCVCGCATTQDYHYCFVQKYRAEVAYKENHGLWSKCSQDYKDGWRTGYYDLSTGQCEEPPPTPPHKYWNPSYQSLEGKAAIDDWYSGWQDGATAAIQDGRPYFHPVVQSPTAPVKDCGPHSFHGGAGGGMEAMPPTPPMPTHEPQPQVHVGPVPQRFASHSIDGDELLDETTLPASSVDAELIESGSDSGYFAPPASYEATESEASEQTVENEPSYE